MQNAERAIGARELSSLNVGSAYVLTVQRGHVLDSIRALRAFSDWGWWVKLLVVPAAPVGHSLLSAVGAEAAASRGPEGGRPNLCGDLRGGCPSAPGSQRDHLARRPHGNDAAPSLPGRELALG